MQSGTKIINGFFLNPMKVGRSQCIVLMHESVLVMRADKFEDLIVQLGETQVETLDGFTIFISEVIVFPQLIGEDFGFPISGSETID